MITMAEGIFCFIICFGSSSALGVGAGDTFCQTYQRVVRTQKEADALKAMPPDVRKRIQGNDLDYLCNCRGWEDVACHQKGSIKK